MVHYYKNFKSLLNLKMGPLDVSLPLPLTISAMLRLPRQQALKALRSPLHNTLHYPVRGPLRDPLRSSLLNRFRSPLLIRHAHTESVPFSGPPSYATINRRFSSEPNPIDFFAKKKAKEAIERGQFIDIHDIGGVDPKDYDVLITDISDNKLRTEIAELLGVPYLQKATEDEANKKIETATGMTYATGIAGGTKFRTVFPCVVSFEDNARWVFFIVDTGAPLTYLSTHVSASAYGGNT